MKIKTYCKEIELNDFMYMKFEIEKNMITFIGAESEENICFPTRDKAFEFYFELIEALYTDRKELDVDHIQVSYGLIHIPTLKESARKRIKEYEPDEE